jgi:uncharacterized protein
VTQNAALRRLGRDRELIGFAVLTFILSWAWWIPIAVAGGTASHFPGLLGPMLAAVVVTAAAGGLRGLRRLPGRLGAPRWWALALSPLVVGAVAVGMAHATGDGPSLGALSDMPGLPHGRGPASSWSCCSSTVSGRRPAGAGWRGLDCASASVSATPRSC